jgi:hypothetical protein
MEAMGKGDSEMGVEWPAAGLEGVRRGPLVDS